MLTHLNTEMEKGGDTGDISLLFFLACANFWVILGHFWAIFGANFLWQNMPLCYSNHFLQLWGKQKSSISNWDETMKTFMIILAQAFQCFQIV